MTLFDGSVDEPSALPSRPTSRAQMRSTAGAVWEAARETGREVDLAYQTVEDERRSGDLRRPAAYVAPLVIVTDALVPGTYRRGRPVSVREIDGAASGFKGTAVLGGPVSYAVKKGGFPHVAIFADGGGDAAVMRGHPSGSRRPWRACRCGPSAPFARRGCTRRTGRRGPCSGPSCSSRRRGRS